MIRRSMPVIDAAPQGAAFVCKKVLAAPLQKRRVSCIIPPVPAGMMELVDVTDSKTGTSIVPKLRVTLDFSRVLRYTVFSKSACSLLSSLLLLWLEGQFGRGSGEMRTDMGRCDGIGRRSGFKIRRWRHRGGSSPPTGTNLCRQKRCRRKTPHKNAVFFIF